MARTIIEETIQDDTSSDRLGLDDDDRDDLQTQDFKTWAPAAPFRLGYTSAICLIINRMIGSGIFTTPSQALAGTNSPGATLLFWVVGAIAVAAASHLYVEFGLQTPRHNIDYKDTGVPRSGGELNYLNYVYRRPVFFATCVFGVAFVIFGNMSGNAIAFAQYIYAAAGVAKEDQSNAAVRGIAIAVATFACSIHAFSRRGGIWLSNILAFIKVGILLLIIITGFCAYGGVFGHETYAKQNLSPNRAFKSHATDTYDYAQAYLAIQFAYGGWNQANLVLTEVRDPKKVFKRSVPAAVGLVIILYMLVNIVYMLVVSKHDQKYGDTAEIFFENTFGQLTGDSNIATRVLSAFLALSSFGNIVTMTFTAARVKQELAKEGVLPWPKFFGSGYDLSWRRLLKIVRRKDAPPSREEQTPVGALCLHWFFTVLLILVTYKANPYNTYVILTKVYSYCFIAFFPAMIGIGMLYLRLNPRLDWKTKSEGFNGILSCLAALLVTVAGLFPVIVGFIPPSAESPFVTSGIPWYITATTAWVTFGLGCIYWFVFRYITPTIGGHQGKRLKVEREPQFNRDNGYAVQDHEIVRISWALDDVDEKFVT